MKALQRFLLQSARSFSADNCTQLAAAISYYVLFSVVPLTIVLVSVFGLVIRDEALRDSVTKEVVDFIGLQPGDVTIEARTSLVDARYGVGTAARVQARLDSMSDSELEALATSLNAGEAVEVLPGVVLTGDDARIRYDNPVSETLRDVSAVSGALTVVGLLGMAWTSSTMFGAIRRALNIVWGVSRPRPFFWQKVADLMMVFGVGVLLLVSVVGTGLLRTLREVSNEALGPVSPGAGPVWALLTFFVPGLFSFVVFCLVYRFVPAATVRWRDVWTGALVAAVLFEAMKNAFAVYVANFSSYDVLYGSLGGILLFLTGTYLSANILLFGAEMVSHMPDLRRGAFDAVPVAGPRKPLPIQVRNAAFGFLRGLFVSADGDVAESPDKREGSGTEAEERPPRRTN